MMAPVRFELIEAMRSIAPCSIRELALALDRPADTLYPHVRQLLKIGVVLDELSDEQSSYLGIPKDGPFKPEHYRY